MSRASDAELLARTPVDGSAFGEFYARYERPVIVYMRRRTRAPEFAADLAAETFARALDSVAQFDPSRSTDGSAAPWLFGIARNTLLMSVRRGQIADEARRRIALVEPLVMDDAALRRIDQTSLSNSALADAVQSLPIEEQKAVLARIVGDQSYGEIADYLECSELVARKRVSRGLGRLRARLGHSLEDGRQPTRDQAVNEK